MISRARLGGPVLATIILLGPFSVIVGAQLQSSASQKNKAVILWVREVHGQALYWVDHKPADPRPVVGYRCCHAIHSALHVDRNPRFSSAHSRSRPDSSARPKIGREGRSILRLRRGSHAARHVRTGLEDGDSSASGAAAASLRAQVEPLRAQRQTGRAAEEVFALQQPARQSDASANSRLSRSRKSAKFGPP